jgi:hypothetical protein
LGGNMQCLSLSSLLFFLVLWLLLLLLQVSIWITCSYTTLK